MFRSCFQHLYEIERKRIITAPNVRMRLNRGECPEPLPEGIRSEIRRKLATSKLQQYPSYPQFYEQLSKHIGFPTKQIVVGAGIEEFIRTLMFLCCDPGQVAAVLWPTCAMYDIYAQAFGVDLIRIIPKPGVKTLTVTHIIQYMEDQSNLRVLFLPNPGQPIETCYGLDEVFILAEWCQSRDIVLAIDEAHFGFGAPTAFPLIKEFDNLIVMRTFSKFFRAASIRVGYVVGQERVIKPINAARPSGEIAGPSMMIASILLEHSHDLRMLAESDICPARDWLRSKMNELGYPTWGKFGFSLLVEFIHEGQARSVAAALAAQGIHVKVGFPPPIEHCIHIACGSVGLMAEFFEEFKGIMGIVYEE